MVKISFAPAPHLKLSSCDFIASPLSLPYTFAARRSNTTGSLSDRFKRPISSTISSLTQYQYAKMEGNSNGVTVNNRTKFRFYLVLHHFTGANCKPRINKLRVDTYRAKCSYILFGRQTHHLLLLRHGIRQTCRQQAEARGRSRQCTLPLIKSGCCVAEYRTSLSFGECYTYKTGNFNNNSRRIFIDFGILRRP